TKAIHTSKCRHLRRQSLQSDNSRTRLPTQRSHLACQMWAVRIRVQRAKTYQWAILHRFLSSTSYVTRSSVIWGHPRSPTKNGPRLCWSHRILKPRTTSPRTARTAS
uniref:Uncharacterized protein n=1 Tax=Fusarium oxysporum (strain Fo5176) TaxID=660025 RepID=A0A0D2YHL8_FUSOF